MSESPQESTLPPEGNAVKQGVDWVAKHWVRVRLAHEGMMLEKIQRQNRIVEVNARNTMTGKVDALAAVEVEPARYVVVSPGGPPACNTVYGTQNS